MADVNPQAAAAALSQHRADILALPTERIRPCTTPGATIVEVAQAWAALLEAEWERIVAAYRSPPERERQELVSRSLAVWSAEAMLAGLDPVSVGPERSAHYQEAGTVRQRSLDVLLAIGRGQADVERALALVQPGTGYRDRADDLTVIHTTLLRRRDEIVRRELMTDAEIERVGVLATLLLRPTASSDEVRTARELRDRAWTFFREAHEQLDRHLVFVLWSEPERYALYPRLRKPATRKAPAETPVEAPTA